MDHNRREGGKDLRARVWERKQYLLDMTDLLYLRTPAAVVTRTRPMQDQATLHGSTGQEGCRRNGGPLPTARRASFT